MLPVFDVQIVQRVDDAHLEMPAQEFTHEDPPLWNTDSFSPIYGWLDWQDWSLFYAIEKDIFMRLDKARMPGEDIENALYDLDHDDGNELLGSGCEIGRAHV